MITATGIAQTRVIAFMCRSAFPWGRTALSGDPVKSDNTGIRWNVKAFFSLP
jgi:hypothetical protein